MKNLHSYWRMQYIEANDQNDASTNPFANLPKGGSDRDALILWRNRKSYLVLNKFPYNPGHLLALPYREVSDLSDLDTEERNDLMDSIIHGKELLSRAFSPDGFNVGFNFGCAAGEGITAHLHCHIVPRWNGDTNFMPVIGKTRVLPQALAETWDRLREHCSD